METIAHARSGAPRRMPRLGPRRILLGIAIALVTAVGTAGATGMIPADVQQALGLAAAQGPHASLTPQIDQAVERTSAPTADDGTLELWAARTTGGGTCAYVRQLDAAGAPTDSGPISCTVSIAGGGRMGSEMAGQPGSHRAGRTMTIGGSLGDGRLSAQIEVDATGAAMLFGQAPSAARVEIVDSAGAVLGEAAARDGWFVLTLPASAASAAASLVALSASGASIDTMSIATPVPPTTASTGAGTDSSIQTASGPASG